MYKLIFALLFLMGLFFVACGGSGGDGVALKEPTSIESNQFGKATLGRAKFE